MRKLTPDQAREMADQRKKYRGGRPPGVTMPCGWGCGANLTASGMRDHFTDCPKRPTQMMQHVQRIASDPKSMDLVKRLWRAN